MKNVTSVGDVIESMLKDIDYPKDSVPGRLYSFKVRVGCIKRRTPRHKYFQWILDMGKENIERVLNYESFNGVKDLTFVFPERWMNVDEQRCFMYILKKHPESETLETVDIITSSPIMISSFSREQILILTWDDDKDCDY